MSHLSSIRPLLSTEEDPSLSPVKRAKVESISVVTRTVYETPATVTQI